MAGVICSRRETDIVGVQHYKVYSGLDTNLVYSGMMQYLFPARNTSGGQRNLNTAKEFPGQKQKLYGVQRYKIYSRLETDLIGSATFQNLLPAGDKITL